MTAQLMILSTAAVVSVSDSMRWGVVLDCGSSGTRVHLYNWDHDVGLESLAEFTPTRKEDQDLLIDNIKGISSFADVPAGVAPYITSLLDQAARWVPSAKQSTTRVHAYATAGMRLLTEARQQPIWQNIDDAMLASGFRYEVGDSATIGGEYEGIFNYLALRHILRSAPAGTPPILGGLDLCGASTQITFAPSSGVILNDAYRLVVNYTAMRLTNSSCGSVRTRPCNATPRVSPTPRAVGARPRSTACATTQGLNDLHSRLQWRNRQLRAAPQRHW